VAFPEYSTCLKRQATTQLQKSVNQDPSEWARKLRKVLDIRNWDYVFNKRSVMDVYPRFSVLCCPVQVQV
jgi:FPC/CPF motif-containing protein YcgG